MSYKAMAEAHQIAKEIRAFIRENHNDGEAIDELQVEIQLIYSEERGVILREAWEEYKRDCKWRKLKQNY